MENRDSLKIFKIIKAIGRGEERVDILLLKTDENIVVYILAQIKKEPKVKKVFIWDVNIPESVKKRLNVVIGWFKTKIL